MDREPQRTIGSGVIEDVEVTTPRDGVAVVALQGEHDLCTRTEVGALLSSLVTENALVVVDVSDAEFIDSSLLHNLVTADRQAREMGSRFVLQLGTAPIVETALESSGLLTHLRCALSREEALSHRDATTDDAVSA